MCPRVTHKTCVGVSNSFETYVVFLQSGKASLPSWLSGDPQKKCQMIFVKAEKIVLGVWVWCHTPSQQMNIGYPLLLQYGVLKISKVSFHANLIQHGSQGWLLTDGIFPPSLSIEDGIQLFKYACSPKVSLTHRTNSIQTADLSQWRW